MRLDGGVLPDTQIAADSGPLTPDGRGGGNGDTLPDVYRSPDTRVAGDSGPDLKDAGAADSGGVETGAADARGAGDSGTEGDPCAGGTTYADSTTAKALTDGYGWVRLGAPTSNKIVEFRTTMLVPETPAATGTLFLWPGLQPLRGGANFSALDNGVLQPVLTWGPTCAPNAPAQSYKSWWISGQYVNTNISSSSPNYAAYHDCHGGQGMNVTVGDLLDIRMALDGNDWTQTVTNRRNSQTVSYTLDMLGQAQLSAEFVIEEYSSKPVSDLIFTSSLITFASAAKSSCQPAQRGKTDYFTAPRASADGLRCCIDKVTLRAEGVAATTPDSP